jgi:predicted SAM-dependent methyltransferase
MDQPEKKSLRLHLGCGTTYLDGYVNIDFPTSEHTIARVKADRYEDLRTLQYPEGTVDEVRSHHVFEHFDRATALTLLARWRRWLKVGGTLVIETPDFEGCAKDFLAAKTLDKKSELLRHIFGSEEAAWAIHYDGWFEEKFRFVFEKLGFEVMNVDKMRSNVSKKIGHGLGGAVDAAARMIPASFQEKVGINTLPNIVITAKKMDMPLDERAAIREMLSLYLVGKEHEHADILEVWMKEVRI